MFKIAIGSVMHESNTFSPITTDLEDFRQDQLLMGEAVFDYHRGKSTEIGGMLEALEKRGVSPEPLISAVAIPSGPVSSETFDFILEKLETDLKKLDNPDGLLLALHGGMSTENIGDTEGFLLRRVRKITGPRTLIGVTLDHHANLSKAMVETADFIIGYKTHPHVDQYDIGVKAAETLLFFLENRRRPTMKLVKLPLLLPGESSPVPRAKLLRLVEKLEKTARVMSASFFIGFPFADHEDVGASSIVVTDGDAELGAAAAGKLAQLIWDLRAEFTLPVVSLDAALTKAESPGKGPVVLVDMGDCSYAGAAGDVPFFARRFLEKHVKTAVIAAIIDSAAVEHCIQAGTGARITLSIGGKLDKVNAEPLSLTGTVELISDGKYTGRDFYLVETQVDIGPTVVFAVGGVRIILVTRRMTTYDPALLRSLNIEPMAEKLIVLKGGMLNSVTYKEIAREIIPFNSPGFACWDFAKLAYKNIGRPVWPLAENLKWEIQDK